MAVLLAILIIITCILLILVVLVQNPKGGGLTSGLTGSNQIMGVRKTTDFLEKATWGLAIALLVFCLLSSVFVSQTNKETTQSLLKDQVTNTPINPSSDLNIPDNSQKAAPAAE